MFGKPLIIASAVLLVTLASTVNAADYDVDALCNLMRNGVLLGSIVSCQTYYRCEDGIGVKNSCPKNQAFHKNSQQCINESQVDCDSLIPNPCASQTGVFVANPSNCGWHQCVNSTVVNSGTCPVGQIFKGDRCIWGDCQVTEVPGLYTNICNVIPINVFFGNTKQCNQWHRCETTTTGEILITRNCPGSSVYNVRTQQCVDYSAAVCERITNGSEPAPDVVGTPCTEGDPAKPSETKCSIHFVCTNNKYTQESCPAGHFFDVTTKECGERATAVPDPKCNRCEGTTFNWANAVDAECRKYFICNTEYTNSCRENSFFNERLQACVGISGNNLEEYREANPVCQ